MAVTFSNNFKSILDKLESLFESEFKGTLPVYKGKSIPKGVSQAISLAPMATTLSGYTTNSESREFSVEMNFVFSEININEQALDHIFRQTSRIEAVIHDNMIMTLADSTKATDCRIEATDYNADEESNFYVVIFDFKCHHTITFT